MELYQIQVPVSTKDQKQLQAYLDELEMPPWSIHQNIKTDSYTLMGCFESPASAFECYTQLRGLFSCLPSKIEPQVLSAQTWQEAYKAYLRPWNERGLHWVPLWDWEEYKLPPDNVAVKLDPGMAFGTGSHETTRLVAQRLLDIKESLGQERARYCVMDAGCGSGILALSAYRLGFGPISAFDIDPEAVRISKEHLALNDIPHAAVSFFEADLQKALDTQRANILLANIQTEILVPHSASILKAVIPVSGQKQAPLSSSLILSGILEQEIEAVRTVFLPLAEAKGQLIDCSSRTMGEWADLSFTWA